MADPSFDSLQCEEECLKFLADVKWKDGFRCRKCGNTHYCAGRKPYSRRCTRCKTEESPLAHTFFHHCHLDLPRAFRLVCLVIRNPGITTAELSEKLQIRRMTCWKLKKKVLECLHTGKLLEYFPGGTKPSGE